jgi:hypothetical protein
VSIRSDVTVRVGRWIALVLRMVRGHPGADIYAILASPAMTAELERRLGQARALAEARLQRAWPASVSPYRARLADDIERAYEMAPGKFREEAIRAFLSTAPALRADVMSRELVAAAWQLGLRNELTVAVAQTRRAGEDVLARAEPGQDKTWVTRRDARVCVWCRFLASLGAIPVDEEFSYSSSVSTQRPPRVYLNLMCPPAHPLCRCRIVLSRAGGAEPVASAPGAEYPLFMPASLVRALPEERYQALRDFHSAALREFGQALRRRL